AHRLQVEADGVGPVVLDPVLHEVVAGDVDPVARRGEDGDAEVATGGRVEVGDGQGTTLGEEAEVTRPRDGRGQGGGEADLGVVVDQAEGVGPDDAHAVGAGQAQDLLLQAGPGLVDLGESRGDDEQGLHPGRGALADDVEDALRGYGD